jgi:hypothetical protein
MPREQSDTATSAIRDREVDDPSTSQGRPSNKDRGLQMGEPGLVKQQPSPTSKKSTPKPFKGFNPVCRRAKRPIVYLLDEFLSLQGSINEEGRFSDYPDPVRKTFKATFDANIALLRLFQIKRVRNIEALPRLLGSGDIVLGFVHAPPYHVDRSSASLDGPLRIRALDDEMDRLFDRFWKAVEDQWKAVANLNTSPLPSRPRLVRKAEENVGSSLFHREEVTVDLKQGGSRKAYYSIMAGAIDIAFPASRALGLFKESKVHEEKMEILRKGRTEQFGPKAVAKVGAKEGGVDYLKGVGRSLAYTLLHEFWHCAEYRGDHPYPANNKTIESEIPVRADKSGVVFQKTAIKRMKKKYDETWCRYIKGGRIGIGELKP